MDEFFPKDARSSAQGLFNFLILGLGPFLGNFLWPWLGDVDTVHREPLSIAAAVGLAANPSEGWSAAVMSTSLLQASNYVNFRNLFLVPAGVSLFAALLLALFFYPPKKPPSRWMICRPQRKAIPQLSASKETSASIKGAEAVTGLRE